MREILFKAKRIDNGEWVEGYFIHDDVSGKSYIAPKDAELYESDKVGEEGCLHLFAFEVDEDTLCQYTGMTDRNGVKIWENDIVNDIFSHKRGKVFFWEDTSSFAVDSRFFGKQIYSGYMWKDVEVIGNVSDNPELMQRR